MFKKLTKPILLTALMATFAIAPARAIQYADDDYDLSDPRIDRYLDVEISTNHEDGEYFEGDNVNLKFRVNQDAFVAIYSIDSRDRVNLIFPAAPGDDNFVHGGVTYRIPDGYTDYDLVVSGPEGVENIQIIASRERFPIPDWFGASGLVNDWDNRFDFMDYINSRYFVKYEGQRFAYDRAAIYINEWEPDYFRPVYYPHYPGWTVCGNVYLDYPWGSSVYIDGIYWGCTPMYVPRLYVGWHTFTVCDRYGYYWESDFHITRYNTVVIDRTIINPSPSVYSKYKEVRNAGFRDPVKNGYPKYKQQVETMKKTTRTSTTVSGGTATNSKISADGYRAPAAKKYTIGEATLVKSSKGYATKSVSRSSIRSTRSSAADNSGSGRSKSSRSTVDRLNTGSGSGRSDEPGRSKSGDYSSRKKTAAETAGTGKVKKSTQSQRKPSGSDSKAGKVSKQETTKPSGSSSAKAKQATPKKSTSKATTSKKPAPKKSSDGKKPAKTETKPQKKP